MRLEDLQEVTSHNSKNKNSRENLEGRVPSQQKQIPNTDPFSVENFNWSVTVEMTRKLLREIPLRRVPRPEGFTAKFHVAFKEQLFSMLFKPQKKGGVPLIL